ncbi:MAG TPA: hypothetical protein VFX02_12660 [Gammaproteobacteria bacterium]|nr:hypothetical protein [Gammaproteobacteria bacterium]
MKYLVLPVLCLLSWQATAYEVETHQKLSEVAVQQSILNPANLPPGEVPVMESLGLQALDASQFLYPIPDVQLPSTSVQQIVQYGVKFEDEKKKGRVANHFFDPVADNGEGSALHIALFDVDLFDLGAASPDWALEDISEVEHVPSGLRVVLSRLVGALAAEAIIQAVFDEEQDYSYRHLMENFYQALTAQNSAVRSQNWAQVFQKVGHVIHHLQDMAQPEHVRNDPHLSLGPVSIPYVTDPSFYEKFTNDQIKQHPDLVPTMLAQSNYAPMTVGLGNPRAYWTNVEGQGIADFTNRNFVSQDTNFVMKDGAPAAGSKYLSPEPNGVTRMEPLTSLIVFGEIGLGIYGEEDACDLLKQSSPVVLPQEFDCPIEFIETDIFDNYLISPPQLSKNPRASSRSAFDKYLKDFSVTPVIEQDSNGSKVAVEIDRVFTLNRFNYDSFQRFLLPRAVKYSAGLIDQVFKKRLKLRKNPEGVGWIVENISDQDLDGEFKLLADGAVLQRHVLDTQNRNLAAGGSFIVPVTLQDQTTSQMIIAFKGSMEGVQAEFDSVTGVVAPGPDGQRGFVVRAGEVDCNSNPIPAYAGLSFGFYSALPQGSFEPRIITDTGLVIDFDAVNIKSASPAVCNSVGYSVHVSRIGDYEYVYSVSLTNPGEEYYFLNVYNHVNHPELSLGIQFEKIYVTNK